MRIGDAVHGLLCEAIDRLSVRGDVVDQAAAVVVERAELGDPGPVPDVVRLRGHVEHLGGHCLFKEADHGLSGAPARRRACARPTVANRISPPTAGQ